MLLLAVTISRRGGAQCSNNHSHPVTITPNPVTVTFGSPTAADFAAGYVDVGPVSVNVAISNSGDVTKGYDFCLKTTSASMGSKPLSDLLWQQNGTSGSWTAMSNSYALLFNNPISGSGPQNFTITLYLRCLLHWGTDGPGTYSANLTYAMFFLK